ncbi:MAG: hypothetical protein AAF654_09010 [Myxococcota bacterium]
MRNLLHVFWMVPLVALGDSGSARAGSCSLDDWQSRAAGGQLAFESDQRLFGVGVGRGNIMAPGFEGAIRLALENLAQSIVPHVIRLQLEFPRPACTERWAYQGKDYTLVGLSQSDSEAFRAALARKYFEPESLAASEAQALRELFALIGLVRIDASDPLAKIVAKRFESFAQPYVSRDNKRVQPASIAFRSYEHPTFDQLVADLKVGKLLSVSTIIDFRNIDEVRPSAARELAARLFDRVAKDAIASIAVARRRLERDKQTGSERSIDAEKRPSRHAQGLAPTRLNAPRKIGRCAVHSALQDLLLAKGLPTVKRSKRAQAGWAIEVNWTEQSNRRGSLEGRLYDEKGQERGRFPIEAIPPRRKRRGDCASLNRAVRRLADKLSDFFGERALDPR